MHVKKAFTIWFYRGFEPFTQVGGKVRVSLLTPKEVAEQRGVSRATVLAWYDAGLLPGVDVSRPGSNRRRIRFTEEDLEEMKRRQLARSEAHRRVQELHGQAIRSTSKSPFDGIRKFV